MVHNVLIMYLHPNHTGLPFHNIYIHVYLFIYLFYYKTVPFFFQGKNTSLEEYPLSCRHVEREQAISQIVMCYWPHLLFSYHITIRMVDQAVRQSRFPKEHFVGGLYTHSWGGESPWTNPEHTCRICEFMHCNYEGIVMLSDQNGCLIQTEWSRKVSLPGVLQGLAVLACPRP